MTVAALQADAANARCTFFFLWEKRGTIVHLLPSLEVADMQSDRQSSAGQKHKGSKKVLSKEEGKQSVV